MVHDQADIEGRQMIDTSIIIVNYNGRNIIKECLHALEEQSYKAFEIIIVDNASQDGSVGDIERFLEKSILSEKTKLIRVNKNLGFAGGNTTGLNYCTGKYIALLNNDTEPDKDWLAALIKEMEDDESVGICASKLIVHGKKIIDSAGDGYSSALKGFKLGEGKDCQLFSEPKYVFGACAGAALYRKAMIDDIGFLDDDFFLIHEDTDLNFRAQVMGWKVKYVPNAIVSHKVRSSIGNMSDMAIYYTLRNNEFVRIKNVPLLVFLFCFPEFLLGMLTEFYYFAIKSKRLTLYLRAKKDVIRMLPSMFRKRKMIQGKRKVTNSYLVGIMTRVWQIDFLKSKLEKLIHA